MAKIISINRRGDLSRRAMAPAEPAGLNASSSATSEGQGGARRGILLEFPKMGDGPLFAA